MGRGRMRKFGWIAAVAALGLSAPAASQGSDLESFIEAVRKRDGSKATELVNSRGSTVLNRRSLSGDTALLVAITNRDDVWTQFLLSKGADPNLASGDGVTPLIAATRIGYSDAVEWLLSKGAKVDGTNRLGETALIVAVQQRHTPIVRVLLGQGADPDRADAAAGYSARDYARRDTRSRAILDLIESAQQKQGARSEDINDFKLN